MPSPIPLDNTLGAVFIGIIFSSIVFGITCLQAYIYYTQHCDDDRFFLQLLVAVLMILDAIHLALLVVFFYHVTVSNFGDLSVLQHTTWSITFQILFVHIISTIIQLFFAWRIYHISEKKKPIPLVTAVIAISQIACAIVFVVAMLDEDTLGMPGSKAEEIWSPLALGLNTICDIFIVSAMVSHFRKTKDMFSRTQKVITRIITYALNTCLLNTFFALTGLIVVSCEAAVARGDERPSLKWLFIVSKCTINTTLYTIFLHVITSIYLLIHFNTPVLVHETFLTNLRKGEVVYSRTRLLQQRSLGLDDVSQEISSPRWFALESFSCECWSLLRTSLLLRQDHRLLQVELGGRVPLYIAHSSISEHVYCLEISDNQIYFYTCDDGVRPPFLIPGTISHSPCGYVADRAVFIGIILSSIVFGITCLQTYMYYTRHCDDDRSLLRLLVAVLMLLDGTHVILIVVFFYHVTVSNFGDFSVLERNTWSITVQVLFVHITSAIIQLFFAWRIYHIWERRKLIPLVTRLIELQHLYSMCHIVTRYAMAYVLNIAVFVVTTSREDTLATSNSKAGEIWTALALALNIICDIFIASAMVFHFKRTKTTFPRFFALTGLVVYLSARSTLAYAPFFFMLPRGLPDKIFLSYIVF
ncbi:uncharacterized protein STEHIDRAFT_114186 [Stereum hirsutum FP-91666 SS1]|uniref:uncharacterized protein n=1 Tax=Stereum hirsutum (strain FP-91666) TaxID=721885 RepID=UPI0004449A99|nr:uncharacterized protein STEHIDRAFT_114186 [Stereum hirsutum FP-91666 SS1]EIM82229.1 hypothetical protein STEHIDRAFT_114186 [Stereum hirsutum FP-91666 SS1]